jgi:hypothetical protein
MLECKQDVTARSLNAIGRWTSPPDLLKRSPLQFAFSELGVRPANPVAWPEAHSNRIVRPCGAVSRLRPIKHHGIA